MYHDDEIEGGRPHVDEILMVKMMVLQGWYGLSDYEAERQANDRISFRHFLNYPSTIPDRSTIWRFRERLESQGKVHFFGMNFRDNSTNKDTQLNEGLSRTPLSSQRIRAMHQRIHHVVIKRRSGAAGMEGGVKRALNLNLDSSCIH